MQHASKRHPSKRHATKYLLALCTTALLAGACNPQIGGEEGNLGLTYQEGPVGGAGSSSPLAVGARLDYAGYPESDDTQRVTFASATSADDKIIRVHQINGGLMTLEGVADGETSVDVEADGPDGEVLTDSFNLEAATVDAIEFDNPCAKEADALYLTDHDVRLHYTMRADGQIAVGYGHYPVEIAPEGGATVGESTINGLLPLRTGSTPGEVTVSSNVDDTDFALTLAEEGDIDGLKVFELDFLNDPSYPVGVGEDALLHLLPTVSGLIDGLQEPAPVCQTDIDVQVESNTPNVCEVAYGPSDQEATNIFQLHETNVLTVTGTSEGSCEVSVTIPGANGGSGMTETISIEVSADAE